MSSIDNWIHRPSLGNTSYFNNLLVLSRTEMFSLATWLITPPISTTFTGDFTKWCSSIRYYPYSIKGEKEGKISLFDKTGDATAVKCQGFISTYEECGYNLGQFYYNEAKSFLDYEPYTKLQLWLPFYGFVDLKISDISNKYVQIRLFVDYHSGQGQYVIGVNEDEVKATNLPYIRNGLDDFINDSKTRIIGTYTAQIGYDIPISSSNASDMYRNIALSAIRGTGKIIGSAIGSQLTGDKLSSTEKEVYKAKDPQTRRMSTQYSYSKEKTTDYSAFRKASRVATAVETATSVLDYLHLSPSVDKSNNSIINTANCNSCVLVKRTVQTSTSINSSDYLKLKGAPLGDIAILGKLSGYTEISEVHIEGDDFKTATETEIAMLEQELSQGIILP